MPWHPVFYKKKITYRQITERERRSVAYKVLNEFVIDERGDWFQVVKGLQLPDYAVFIYATGAIKLEKTSVMAKALSRVGWIKFV